MRNFRVHFTVNNQSFREDFSMDGVINKETKSISAWKRIKRAHPDANSDDIDVGYIEELEVWS